ncbi:MAG TPA: DUF6600 domain-containing protein [Anaeromyxobacter sp.]|nr:DUF6600 domain-containing protein [Anaeromyxobacter sp.]
MLRRAVALVALAAAVAPAAGRAQEWEEDYTGATDQAATSDEYPVSVDVDASTSVDLATFQDSLQPYGEWVVAGSYGRVWRPRVATGWRPYYYGRWEWTDEGWLWASDEPWGWAGYHYGRWAYDPYYGWIWVPGYQWAPAWVSWRYSGDVVGWAPLAPGVSVYVSDTPFVDAGWTFVPCNSFVAMPVYQVAYPPSSSRRWFDASAPAPARQGLRTGPGRPAAAPAWGGPPRRAIEARIGRPVTPVRVVTAASPGAAAAGRPGEVAVYRPELRHRLGEGNAPGRPAALPPPGSNGERSQPLGGSAPGPAIREVHPAPRIHPGTAVTGGGARGAVGGPVLPQGAYRGGVGPAVPAAVGGQPAEVRKEGADGGVHPAVRGVDDRDRRR